MKLGELDTANAARVLALLDQAVDCEPAEREAWLAAHAVTDPELDALLRDLLHAVDDACGDGVPRTRNLVARQLASVEHDNVVSGAPGKPCGAYRLLKPLGHGGMGAVWLAERADGLFTRQVALKLVHPSLIGSAAGERFARERAILAGLTHPHITRLLDAGFTDDGQPYLALEYVDGVSVTEWCDRERLSVRSRLEIFRQILSAVQYAHANLVVHRDLKPTNILVTKDGQARLLDFGIAKLLADGESHETALTQAAGRALTLAYASPEQIAGRPITIASDVYSLGVILYELLCGVRPYRLERESAGALEDAILSVDPIRPSQSAIADENAAARATTVKKLGQILAGDLDTIVGKALKKDPADRYMTVEAFAQDLQRSVDGEPVLARPASSFYRLRKAIARHKLAAAASALTVVSLASGAGVATWEAIQARAERAKAERVTEFIGSIFESANPYVSGKPGVTARDMLNAGVERVTRELANEPAMAATLLSVLSGSYHNLGEVDLALDSARKADALAARAFLPNDPERAKILRVLGEATSAKGEVREARALIERAVAIQRALGAPAELELAHSLSVFADVTVDQGDEPGAIALARESLVLATHARGAGDPFTIALTGDLSNKLMIARQSAEALEYADRAYRAALDTYHDRDHPGVVLQLSNYAYALDANSRFQEAKERWQSVIDSNRRTFNRDGPQVAQAVYALARSQERLGELEPALDNFRESLAMMNRYGANVSGETATRYFAIGRTALSMRRSDVALPSIADAIAHGSKAFGPQSARVHDAENFRAASLIYAGELEQAGRLLSRRTAEDRAAHAPSLPLVLRYRALLDRARGNVDGSLAAAQEAWDLTNAAGGGNAWTLGAAAADLGRAQIDAGLVDAAAATLELAVALLQQAEPSATPQQADAWLALGRVRLAQARADEAAGWLKRSAEFWERFDSQNTCGGEAAHWYGVALRGRHDNPHARQQFARAKRLLAHSTWPAHHRLPGLLADQPSRFRPVK